MGNDKQKNLHYTLTKKTFIFLVVYYCVLLIAGIAFCVYVLSQVTELVSKNLLLWTSICSIASSVTFSSIHYLKIIYKASITERIDPPNGISLCHLGNIIYFVLRPIFAMAFSIITIFAMVGGLIIITTSLEYIINERFLYLSVAISSIIGFSTGTVLDKFNFLSKQQIEKNLFVGNDNKEDKTNDENNGKDRIN